MNQLVKLMKLDVGNLMGNPKTRQNFILFFIFTNTYRDCISWELAPS